MDLTKHRQGVQIEYPGCFSQRDFATLGPLAVRVDRDAVRVAEAPHTRLRPPVQSACSFKLAAAVAAAPYMHKKRTEDDPMSPLRYSMDLTKLTDEELALFERILIKAHRPVPQP